MDRNGDIRQNGSKVKVGQLKGPMMDRMKKQREKWDKNHPDKVKNPQLPKAECDEKKKEHMSEILRQNGMVDVTGSTLVPLVLGPAGGTADRGAMIFEDMMRWWGKQLFGSWRLAPL